MKTQRSRRRSPRMSLKEALREFLTPALWKQAQQVHRQSRRASRWFLQPLVLVLLFMTWTCGDSQDERFETARAYAQVCLPKRRRPGKSVQGFQKALSRLPMRVLRTLSAGVRRLLPSRLTSWEVDGFVPIGCDGSRVACPRARELEARLGEAGKDGSAPTLWVTALVHLVLGVPWTWRFGKGTASERAHLELMIPLLPPKALVVTDAGYCGYQLARKLLQGNVQFLLRLSSNVTLYTDQQTRLSRRRDAVAYYWPSQKTKGAPPLKLRVICLRARRRKNDVWLLTNVMNKTRLPVTLAGQMYRWRWENEGCFRSYKHTIKKVKLVGRTVRTIHREAEGSWLALQLLLAQGALAQSAGTRTKTTSATVPIPCSPRQVLRAIRDDMNGRLKRGQPRYWERLQRAKRERRERTSKKQAREWPRRKPHKPPKPPKILKLTPAQKAAISSTEAEIAA